MKRIVSLLLNIFYFYESKNILLAIKNKQLSIFIIKTLLTIIAYIGILFFPIFFNFSNLLWIIVISIILVLFLLFFIIRMSTTYYMGKEKLDNNIITYQMDKSDLVTFLKSDYVFVIKFSLIISTVLFFIQFLILTTLLSIKSISSSYYFYLIIIYLAFYYIGIFLFLFIHYLVKMDRNASFIKIDSTKRINNKFIIFSFFLFVVLSILLLFLIFQSFLNNIILSFIISLFLSIIVSILFVFLLNKVNFFNKVFWILFFSKLKESYSKTVRKINVKDIKSLFISMSFFSPLIIIIIAFITLSFVSIFLKVNLWIKITSSIIIGLFFTLPFFKNRYIFSKIKSAFTFTISLFSIFMLISLISQFKLSTVIDSLIDSSSPLFIIKDFIIPLLNYINNIFIGLEFLFTKYGIYITAAVPILFFIVLFLSFKINQFFEFLSKKVDENIKKSLTLDNTSMLFGDSLSLYPFALSSIGLILLFSIIFIELKPFSNLIASLFTTFEIQDIFHLNIFTKENIYNILHIFVIIIFTISLIKLILKLLSAVLSHIILFSDELIYISNKGYKTTIVRIPLDKINYIVLKQNILEKLFNIGNIYVETFDNDGLVKISSVTHIKEKSILIMEKIKIVSQK